ncbi:hypothetical protein ONZ45_g323 [Pleurotus djamor]|nr:hypothetical protein ONZ45_g323 [Pleurotus djamor]
MSTPERDSHLLSIGKQCSDPACLLVDFLPFKCQHCEQSYCGEHFKVEAHKCPSYDESKFDRIAPNCPLCNSPVAIPPNQDPNIRMEQHLTRDCSVMTGKDAKSRSGPVCARVKCGKTLIAPIKCTQCKQQFCPAHRFPADHACASPAPSVTRPGGGNTLGSAPGKSLADLYANVKKSAATKAASVSTPKPSKPISTATATSTPRPIAAPPSTTSSSKASPLPFSKTDRRAKAERESRRKAMEARAKKGLLSEEDKAKWAAEEAEARDKGECLVM